MKQRTFLLTVATVVALGVLMAGVAAADPGSAAQGGRWTKASPQAAALHEQIQAKQLELRTLEAGKADAKTIAAKQGEIKALRDKLHAVNVKNRASRQVLGAKAQGRGQGWGKAHGRGGRQGWAARHGQGNGKRLHRQDRGRDGSCKMTHRRDRVRDRIQDRDRDGSRRGAQQRNRQHAGHRARCGCRR